jgi:hypothetical protein
VNYLAFGLVVASPVALPELRPSEGRSQIDVKIVLASGLGPTSASTTQYFEVQEGALTIPIPDVATFQIKSGKSITIWPSPEASESEIRLYLLGSAMGAILHQRGMLPLHASTVQIGEDCSLFMGPSGIGKSTLSAAFHRRGFQIMTDDVCVVKTGNDGRPQAVPAYPQFKLWVDSLDHLEVDHTNLSRMARRWDKKALLPKTGFASREAPIARLYSLEVGPAESDISISPMKGVQKFEELVAQTYRPEFMMELGMQETHFRHVAGLAERVPLFRVRRPASLDRLEELVDALIGHAAQGN